MIRGTKPIPCMRMNSPGGEGEGGETDRQTFRVNKADRVFVVVVLFTLSEITSRPNAQMTLIQVQN